MKMLLGLSVALFTMGAFAQGDLNAMKTKANSAIDGKISKLETAKTCINDAATVDKFKACKYDAHEGKWDKQKMEEKADETMSDLKGEE